MMIISKAFFKMDSKSKISMNFEDGSKNITQKIL